MMLTAHELRPPAAAGEFYPADPAALHDAVSALLRKADAVGPLPKALIVPHASYAKSGPVAASGYALLKPIRRQIERVVLLGPSHQASLQGIATSSADAFATPLGEVQLDAKAVDASLRLPQVCVDDEAHQREHSLEVQLPFLQCILGEFSLIPFAVGHTEPHQVAALLESLWHDESVLVVISSNLSHCHDYWTARRVDSETSHLIERRWWNQVDSQRACGYCAIGGLLQMAKAHGLKVKTFDLRNSGDTAGVKEEVVGYGAFAVF